MSATHWAKKKSRNVVPVEFLDNQVKDPIALVEWITSQSGTAKLRPDQKLVFSRLWDTPKDRLTGVTYLAKELAKINEGAG